MNFVADRQLEGAHQAVVAVGGLDAVAARPRSLPEALDARTILGKERSRRFTSRSWR